MTPSPNDDYVGRFAPSPSGPLHFGSLVSALASYLDARAANGRWLVRIDDIDPPREQAGAADAILRSLERHGLHWDGEVLYQSTRSEAYLAELEALKARGLIYPCDCTRKQIAASGGVYNGHCRHHRPTSEPVALRLKLLDLPDPFGDLGHTASFEDLIQGHQSQDLAREVGDAVVRRKDGFFAYQLAVVVDDAWQGITHVIRGCDLMDVTARQVRFFQIRGDRVPAYGHIPVAVTVSGDKLSKQNRAPALDDSLAADNLWRALAFLRQNPPVALRRAGVEPLLEWALTHWDRSRLEGLCALEPA